LFPDPELNSFERITKDEHVRGYRIACISDMLCWFRQCSGISSHEQCDTSCIYLFEMSHLEAEFTRFKIFPSKALD